jgi:ferredoxin-thioredoxin reductase catalytic subunit
MSSAGAKVLYEKLKKEAEAGGYLLNPDVDFVLDLMEGLITNQKRYGYRACPCRLAEGVREQDLDIICPCDYRDPDLDEHGACYCALYLSEEVATGQKKLKPVPERKGAPTDKHREEPVGFTRNDIPYGVRIWLDCALPDSVFPSGGPTSGCRQHPLVHTFGPDHPAVGRG